MEALPNRFDFATAEKRIYEKWERAGYFHSEPDAAQRPFCMVIPPPNVTGALHLGHALNNTLQDVLARFRRMQGFNTLWMPGTDHAGIATQAVVERRLREEDGLTRHDLGREELLRRIWQWKDAYEARIIDQLKQMGASCDWQRTRFTLDAQCARAVRVTFFDLFTKRLIYRGKRLVNWDTFLQTAVSDDELTHELVQGHFWHVRYPVIDPRPGEPAFVVVATTRPETMLGDTAVAVHPDPAGALQRVERELRTRLATAPAKERPAVERQLQEVETRRQELLPQLVRLRDMAASGRMIRLPLMERAIPLIADAWAKPELGSGCVKITPAHDSNDYEVGLRHQLPMINILRPDGTLNEQAGSYAGRSIAQARADVVADLDRLGLLADVEDREIDLAHSDRSKTPIEPYLADQWFVRMDQLAQSASDAVHDGRVRIIPERFTKGYHDWLAEKRDWPVSRQLWWGHQIPIWSRCCPDTAAQAALESELTKLQLAWPDQLAFQCAPEAGEGAGLFCHTCIRDELPELETQVEALGMTREADVLDTWFSSALWPHSTLGWPESTPELAYYYPTSTLITSRDIITLWVARMVLAGLNNMGEVPFQEVFIHPKILDGFGETMSKSKGNGVDPLDVIQKFGADALRFALTYLTTDTQDVRMPVQFECPHCDHLLEQTRQNRELPRLTCDHCGGSFSTQWATSPEDRALPRGPVVSERFELARNFGNKLWNAARFVLLHLEGMTAGAIPADELMLEDRWILSRLAAVTADVTSALESYRFAEAARTLYDFAWDEFCSFYVEMAKRRLADAQQRPVAQRVLAHTLDRLLRLLHPLMPFITEEIWGRLREIAPQRGLPAADSAAADLIIAAWPQAMAADRDEEMERQFAKFQQTLGALREIRSRQGIAPKKSLEFSVRCDDETAQLLAPMQPYFEAMACASATDLGRHVAATTPSATVNLNGWEVHVDLRGLLDVQAELVRNEKQRARLEGAISGKQKKLATADFVSRAPAEVVERERASLVEMQEQLRVVENALEHLRSLGARAS